MRSLMIAGLLHVLLLSITSASGLLVVLGADTNLQPASPSRSTSIHMATRPQVRGNGARAGAGPIQQSQARVCSNPLDVACQAQTALAAILAPVAQNTSTFNHAILQNFAAALAPVPPVKARGGTASGAVQTQPLNFITQTPLCFSTIYSACSQSALDATVAAFTNWAQIIASSALGLIIVVGGFSILIGKVAGLRMYDASEFLPRVALVSLAAFFAPSIVQAFIDLNNLLCQGVLAFALIDSLVTQLAALANPLVGDPGALFVELLVVDIMAILLIGQMALRLALVALLGGLAPLGLLCFALPQTLSWGRLWMQQFSLAVFVQFMQVAALALGGALLADLSTPTAALFAGIPDATTIVKGLLLIVLFYLALRLPTMISSYVGSRVTDEINGATRETIASAREIAGEVLALFA